MSLLKNEIKFLRSLQQKKFRDEHQLFVVEGPKLVAELLAQSNFKVDRIFATEAWDDSVAPDTEIVRLSGSELERISGLNSPNQVLATVKMPQESILSDAKVVLALDGINDPGNLGTILRTADWFGISNVLASEDSVELYNPKVVQASMGAIFRVRYRRTSLLSSLRQMENDGYTIYLAEMEGTDIDEVVFPEKTVLVMGSESHGVRELEGNSITIPALGQSESLNVAVAAGILMKAATKS